MKDRALRRLHILLTGFAVTLLTTANAFAAPDATSYEVPATNDWGMFIMVLLVLTGSTFALYGGGFMQRSMAGPFDAPVEPTPAPPEKPARSTKPRRKKRSSRRPKFRRPIQRDRSVPKVHALSRHVGRSSQSKKKRDGPGIRG